MSRKSSAVRTTDQPFGVTELERAVDRMTMAHARGTGMFTLMGLPSTAFWLNPSLNRMLTPLVAEIGPELFRLLVADSSSLGTEEDYQAMVTVFADNFPEGFLAWGRAVGSIGWGRFELPHFEPETRTARVVVHNTWELEMQRHNPADERWGCPFIQGKLIGLFSTVFGEPVWATEVHTSYDPASQHVVFAIAPSRRTIDAELIALRAAQQEKRARELRRLQNLAEERDEARRANEAKSAFLAAMSHELRTPLNAILGYTELARETLRDAGDEEVVSDLGRVVEASNHLLDLVSQVLELSRVEAGQLQLVRTSVALDPFLDRVERMVRPLGSRNRNTFVSDRPAELGSVVSDETRLFQVLVNVLGNAFKFTEDGTISLRVRRDTEAVTFTISDTGIGIPEDRLASIFESFTQADRSIQHRFGGTGLGLAIAHQLVTALGGSLRVDSTPGVGSVFTVQLPAA